MRERDVYKGDRRYGNGKEMAVVIIALPPKNDSHFVNRSCRTR